MGDPEKVSRKTLRDGQAAIKRNIIKPHNSLDDSPGSYAGWETPIPEGWILYDFMYATLLKCQ